MSRVVAVIQARTGSTRLPRKVLRDLGGQTVLEWVVRAARDSGVCDDVVVATTFERDDDEVAGLAVSLGAGALRGPVDDVLSRYILAADATNADMIVRLTADCPLLDPAIIAACVRMFDPAHLDYVTTDHEHSIANGFDVEVVGADVLRKLDGVARTHDRAHVTSYISAHPGDFRIATVGFEPRSTDLRVTLDEPSDAALLDAIVAELGPRARDYRRVVHLLRSRPDFVALNAGVRAKPLRAG